MLSSSTTSTMSVPKVRNTSVKARFCTAMVKCQNFDCAVGTCHLVGNCSTACMSGKISVLAIQLGTGHQASYIDLRGASHLRVSAQGLSVNRAAEQVPATIVTIQYSFGSCHQDQGYASACICEIEERGRVLVTCFCRWIRRLKKEGRMWRSPSPNRYPRLLCCAALLQASGSISVSCSCWNIPLQAMLTNCHTCHGIVSRKACRSAGVQLARHARAAGHRAHTITSW